MLNRCFLSFTLIATLLAPPALAASTPADPITAIYRKVAAGKGEDGGTFVYIDSKARARWLSKSLAAL